MARSQGRGTHIRGHRSPSVGQQASAGWVLVIRDMTHEREMQQQIRHQERMASLGQLTGGIAHDFNNLLTAILGYTQFAISDLGSVDSLHEADPTQIEQVILNLAVNARDAIPDGGHLSIKTANVELDEAWAHKHPESQPGAHVLLKVSDTGFGMSDEVLKHLFEPFFTTKDVARAQGWV